MRERADSGGGGVRLGEIASTGISVVSAGSVIGRPRSRPLRGHPGRGSPPRVAWVLTGSEPAAVQITGREPPERGPTVPRSCSRPRSPGRGGARVVSARARHRCRLRHTRSTSPSRSLQRPLRRGTARIQGLFEMAGVSYVRCRGVRQRPRRMEQRSSPRKLLGRRRGWPSATTSWSAASREVTPGRARTTRAARLREAGPRGNRASGSARFRGLGASCRAALRAGPGGHDTQGC